MKNASLRMDKLARSSQRLNKAILLLSGLMLLLSSTCYWAVSRLLESEQQRLELHFARVIEIIHEHEIFLRNLANSMPAGRALPAPVEQGVMMLDSTSVDGKTLVKAKGFELSLPFTLAYTGDFRAQEIRGALALGLRLTDYYGGFWARSFYASPQLFVLERGTGASIAVPAAGDQRQHQPLLPHHYVTVVDRLVHLLAQPDLLPDQHVHWVRAPARLYNDNLRMVALLKLGAEHTLKPSTTGDRTMVLAAVMDTEQIDEFERVLRLSVYNQFTLISPDGKVLMGERSKGDLAPLGLSFNRSGLRFKMMSSSGDAWTGLYAISYGDFLRYAKWPLLGLALTIIAAILLGLWVNHWYKSRIVRPAQRAQVRLAESEAFSRIILHNVPVGLCVVRRHDHRVLLENECAVHLGVTAAVLQLLRDNHGDQAPGELCLLVDGRYVQVVAVATRYDGEDVFLCGCNDITRHVGEQLQLNQAHQRATAANEAKTVFLATMSHEIRTPLYGVLGNLELLSLTELSERQRHYLQIIETSSTVLFQLISNVLDVTKIESGQMAFEHAAFDPRQLVDDAHASFEATAQSKGLQLEAEIDAQVPARVEGDAGRIRQILHNLLGNAIKFTPSGRVRLRLIVQERSDQDVLLQWQVTDTGKGIPEKALEHLFKPFYQVSAGQEGGGAGLGLSICSRLSESMGGTMRVVSEPGLGSSFSLFIRLPIVASSPALVPVPKEGSQAPSAPLKLSVLVAEDNPVSQAVMREQLEAIGAYPTVAADGHQALQLWQSKRFDMVITDINMPRMNGYELTRALREAGVEAPIIGITANALREEGERCLQAGMTAWIVKPLSLGTLRQVLMNHCPGTVDTHVATDPGSEDFSSWIQLSQPMRQLLAQTLASDIEQLEKGVIEHDAVLVEQRLHSLSGALASINATALYGACQRLENMLQELPLDARLGGQVRALCRRLAKVAQRLSDEIPG
ncbi:ATP-binding protein [Pseudomonas fulva]|uniref:ATP-binding protein n=1 Tax=Pseudomonas fulva TaxID=47880 RepID=UPI002449E3A7|nr:ATP-binding protein [Pseudomonas fulva]MDH1308095.1 ATP-binding protein [Pseudomonas fulva]